MKFFAEKNCKSAADKLLKVLALYQDKKCKKKKRALFFFSIS